MRYATSYAGRTLSQKQIRDAIARFEETGRSGAHSKFGLLLAHICNHCVSEEIPFMLFYAGSGYYIVRATVEEQSAMLATMRGA